MAGLFPVSGPSGGGGGGGTTIPLGDVLELGPRTLGAGLGLSTPYDPTTFAIEVIESPTYLTGSRVEIGLPVSFDFPYPCYSFAFEYSLFEAPRGRIDAIFPTGDLAPETDPSKLPQQALTVEEGIRMLDGQFSPTKITLLSPSPNYLATGAADQQVRLVSIDYVHVLDPSQVPSYFDSNFKFSGTGIYTAAEMDMPAPLDDAGLLLYKRTAIEGENPTATFSEMLNNECRAANKFFRYEVDQIALYPFDAGPTTVLEDKILSPLSMTYAWNQSKFFGGYEISFTGRTEEDTGTETDGTVTVTRYEFENAISTADLRSPLPLLGGIVYSSGEELKEPGNCFDNGGRTKKGRRIREVNGTPVEVGEVTYGLVFTSRDAYTYASVGLAGAATVFKKIIKPSMTSGDLNSAWQIVESTITRYFYDGDGYLSGSEKTGFKLMRFQRESKDEQAEIQRQLYAAVVTGPSDPAYDRVKVARLVRQFNSYAFSTRASTDGAIITSAPPTRYPVHERTAHVLEPFSDYYDDIDLEADPPPKWAAKTYRNQVFQDIAPNPLDSPSDPNSPYPPLIVRKETKEITSVFIQIPTARGDAKKKPERFVTNTYTQNTEGEYSKDAIKLGSSVQSTGRPSVHTRQEGSSGGGSSSGTTTTGPISPLPPVLSGSSLGGGFGSIGSGSTIGFIPGTGLGSTIPGTLSGLAAYENKKIIVTEHSFGTPTDFTGSTPRETTGTISYDGIPNDTILVNLLNYEVQKANTRLREVSFKIPLAYWSTVREGDRFSLGGEDYIVLSKKVSGTLANQEDNLYYGEVEITAGLMSSGIMEVSIHSL